MLNENQMMQGKGTDGKPAKLFVLTNSQGTQVTLMDIGATWLGCKVQIDGAPREVLLGVNSMSDHLKQEAYLGATIGRYANRINKGRFTLGERRFRTSVNQGENTLHGGKDGFDKRRWQVAYSHEQRIVFTLESPDGDQGFPGYLLVKATYELADDNTVSVAYQAVTNKACPVNLTNHAYFNLDGESDEQTCLSHQMQIIADQYVPNDEVGIPLGRFNSVSGSGFDFRQPKRINNDFMLDKQQQLASGYDHAFILDPDRNAQAIIASVISSDQRVQLDISTTKPAIHLYTGNFLAGVPNRQGREYNNQAGFALETQFVADAPNNPYWTQPSCILEAGQTYKHKTDFRLTVFAH